VYILSEASSDQVRVLIPATFHNMLLYGEELLAPPNTKLEYHPLLVVRECLFNIFAATIHIWTVAR